MKTRRLFLVALPLLAAAPSAQELEWPGFRGPRHDGVARGAQPPLEWGDEKNLAWKTELPGPGSSSPIVVGDRVWVTCYSGYGSHLDDNGDRTKLKHHLVCLARKTGRILWNRAVPGPLEKDARRMQLSEHGFASPTPVTDGKSIFCYFGRAGVVAFDLEGEVRWQTDLGMPSEDAPKPTNQVIRDGKVLSLRWGAGASPILHDGLVIVNASEESNSIRALDQETGKLVWKRESSNLEGSAISPAVFGPPGGKVLVIVIAGEIWGMQPKTGELLWEVETEARSGMVPTPVGDEKIVYAFGGSGDGHALRIQPDLGQVAGEEAPSRVVWKSKNVGIPSPVLHDGRLFLVSMKGDGVCMDAKDGKVLFDSRLPGRTSQVYASPVLAAGRLYVVSRKRGTFVYSADEKLELLSRNELEGDKSQFNASPAIVGKQLFLRSDKFLYCFSGA